MAGPLGSKIKSLNKDIYLLDTTNSRVIENIINYIENCLLGSKTFEFKLWSRSYRNDKGVYNKLFKVREILRKVQVRNLALYPIPHFSPKG
jgi:hypothetical protein